MSKLTPYTRIPWYITSEHSRKRMRGLLGLLLVIMGGALEKLLHGKQQRNEQVQQRSEGGHHQRKQRGHKLHILLQRRGRGPFNNELPREWNGAECVRTTNGTPCDIRTPGKALGCVCRATGRGWYQGGARFSNVITPGIRPNSAGEITTNGKNRGPKLHILLQRRGRESVEQRTAQGVERC